MSALKENINAENLSELDTLPAQVAAVMDIDLGAIVHNYRVLCDQLTSAKCAAVVKADAYGFGADQVAPVLAKVGCRDFFVATIDEAIALRNLLPEVHIYMLNGLLPGSESTVSNYKVIPVLNDIAQIVLWQNWTKKVDEALPAIVHLDTGMWRAGLPPCEVKQLANEPERLRGIDVRYFMSHLACSDQPEHPKNFQQLQLFKESLKILPPTPASLANSHGVFLGPEYHFDLVRPGRSLYGIGVISPKEKHIRPVVKVFGKITQVRNIEPGETAGYDAVYHVTKPTRLATLGVGYSDGLPRTLDNHGAVFLGKRKAAIVGGVSMDLLTIDVSEVPQDLVFPGAWVEIIGENITADDVATNADRTTSREVLVNLGKRYHRLYR